MAKGTAVAKQGKTQVVDWKGLVSGAAKQAVTAAAALTPGSNFISFKAGRMTVAGVDNPEGLIQVVVLGVMNERAWYEGKYDPGNPSSPACYAYGEDGELPEAPHEKSTKPQHDNCKECEHSQWGSADNGKGQACRQALKLAVVQVGKNTGPDELAKLPILQARVPASSLKNAKAWLDYIADAGSACFAWVTALECKPHPQNIFTVRLTPDAEIAAGWRGAIAGRLDEAAKLLQMPYPEFETAQSKPAAGGKRRF